ncbi:deoxynucleoside kinase [Sulfuricella denitrificans skB26]|uniref:Deoxynucleoside kinase n=1 Tax=Sulfuricella denitrificans (strain DSM 22764 / NBRC 105220 / skB26) TaxID=1163617 RepID=S6B687_SULDS|nr:deoxynucleoside kinase [Sulfuricella denitrificans]BAN36027.1 deoxynucleoside kinase [Sulfuricella denitrificans skB26]
MLFEKYHYVVIAGPIGVGKTSLAQLLSERFQSALMLENADANPFLPRFYQDAERYALPTQLSFLLQRASQVQELKRMGAFGGAAVADFMLDKDLLFAKLNLSEEEYHLYRQIYDNLQLQTPRPDLVIYLQVPPEVLAERVRRRGVEYESTVSVEYLTRVADSYSEYFYHYEASPLLIINSENLNYVDQSQDLELLIERVGQMRGGREFFNWAG